MLQARLQILHSDVRELGSALQSTSQQLSSHAERERQSAARCAEPTPTNSARLYLSDPPQATAPAPIDVAPTD